MVLVRILGGIDLVAAFAFLMMTFGLNVFTPFIFFCGGLLFLKGLFILRGNILSGFDMLSAFFLIGSIFINLPIFFIWIPSFFLLAKGFVSFI
jgi:hypothetical protein